MALNDWLDSWEKWGDNPALIRENRRISYVDLARHIRSRADEIQQNTKGNTVGLWSTDPFEYILDFFAALHIDRTVVGYSSQKSSEWQQRLEAVRVDTVLKGFSPDVKGTYEVNPADGGRWVLFSSGSSGIPKCMVHSFLDHCNGYRLKKPNSSPILATLQLDHIGGIHTLFQGLTGGHTLVFPFSQTVAEWVRAINQHRVTILPTTPSVLQLLLLEQVWNSERLPSLRLVSFGSEPITARLLTQLREHYPQVRYRQTFGTSETGIAQTEPSKLDPLAFHLDFSSGAYRIEQGELWIKSNVQVSGYLNHDNEAFTRDGWFRTGDLVQQLEDGSIRILGRKSRIINVGGEKFHPEEVEQVIAGFPEVLDCRVYGEAYGLMGQRVVAELVLAATELEPSVLFLKYRMELNKRFESFKVPSRWKKKDSLAMNERLKKVVR